jgi:putative glycosyltransferase (TIGR04372 family)
MADHLNYGLAKLGQFQSFVQRTFTANRVLLLIGQIWAVPIVMLIRLIQPLVVIRIDCLLSEYLGHYSDVEIQLCERDQVINQLPKCHLDLWFNFTSVVSNTQLERMLKRELTILPRFLLAPVYRLNRVIPFGKVHQDESIYHDRDVNDLLGTHPPRLAFTLEEEEIGRRLLAEMGIPNGAHFVCLNVRDNAFHNQKKFTNYRNADVRNYLLAADELTKQGFYVVRMGKKVEQLLEADNKKILDYASSSFRNDFMDIYLGAKCFFAISTSSGWDSVPEVLFRRPVLYTNFVPISRLRTWNSTIAILKRHWLTNQNRFLTQSEIFYLIDKDYESSSPKFDELGIVLIDNTEEEIRDAVLEMLHTLSTRDNIRTHEESRKHSCFWDIYKRNLTQFSLGHLHGTIRMRIGAKFLDTAVELTQDTIDSNLL